MNNRAEQEPADIDPRGGGTPANRSRITNPRERAALFPRGTDGSNLVSFSGESYKPRSLREFRSRIILWHRIFPAHSRSADVKRQAIFLARWAGRGAFKATALVLAFVIIVALWLWNASLLTTAADQNLRIITMLTQLLQPDWASKAESALRIFGADRALLLVEGIAIAKLIMLAIAYPFH